MNPVTNEPTGLKLWIAGPDSNVHVRAAEWAAGEASRDLMLRSGAVTLETMKKRRAIATGMLARLIVRWDVHQNGQPVPLTLETAIRVLEASDIIREQVDAFAASRDPWRPKTEGADGRD